jgi:hypothetical protein
VLRVIYHAVKEPKPLVKNRLAAIAREIREEWKRRGQPYLLTIETRANGKGQ